MPTEISLEPQEKLIFKDTFHEGSRTYPVTFAVTDRAVFVTREKHLAKESFYLERIPLSRIRQVFLSRRRRWSMLISSALVFLFGLTLTVLMVIPYLNGEETAAIKSAPFFIMIFGLIMPFLSKKRKTLIVQLNDGIYKWKPQLTLDKISRARTQGLQEQFLDACRSVGVHVMEEIEY
jgi:hypothetical protein